MNQGEDKQSNLIDTTDCLEAIGVFRGWKNGLFVIIALCLFLLQVSFWLVDTGYVKAENKTEAVQATAPATELPAIITPPPAKDLIVLLQENEAEQPVEKPGKIEKPAEKPIIPAPNQPGEPALQDANQPAETAPKQQKTRSLFGITFRKLSWLVRFVNFVLVPAAALYCLTMLFSLKVSLLGRLGGINHIARAFFLSLAFLVLLLPWQRFFGPVVKGVIYTPGELVTWLSWYAGDERTIFGKTLYYLRFTGYWLLVLILLIFSQIRSVRWAKAILRRLEII